MVLDGLLPGTEIMKIIKLRDTIRLIGGCLPSIGGCKMAVNIAGLVGEHPLSTGGC